VSPTGWLRFGPKSFARSGVAAIIVAVGLVACSSPSQKSCGGLQSCQAAAARRFGHALLAPPAATFVQGAADRGVMGLEFNDRETGRVFSEFAGRPGSKQARCPGQIIVTSTRRSFCFGRNKSSSVAQFVSGGLLYTVALAAPSGSGQSTAPSAADQDAMTHIVAELV
jgi:hypothetical protein